MKGYLHYIVPATLLMRLYVCKRSGCCYTVSPVLLGWKDRWGCRVGMKSQYFIIDSIGLELDKLFQIFFMTLLFPSTYNTTHVGDYVVINSKVQWCSSFFEVFKTNTKICCHFLNSLVDGLTSFIDLLTAPCTLEWHPRKSMKGFFPWHFLLPLSTLHCGMSLSIETGEKFV